jgi:DNA-binding CsgD family transcriptional regulator/tetratricopeptide (TPR) repeat protein
VDLLERDTALATLAEAWEAAGQGEGRAVFVTGEPGIGKTSLVGRFLSDLGPDARVLVGTCDDLSIPRPFGPIRDLAGCVSPLLEQALSASVPPYEIQTLLLAELEQLPQPTVLVVEDVHWADDATLDLITVLGRRIGSLPALLVLTFRGGEAAPGHPLYATLGSIRAEDSVVIELEELSKRAVASLCGNCADVVYAVAGGNPFYVTEMLACRDADEPPPSVANAVLGRASRLDATSRRLVELVSVVPNRVRIPLLDAVMPDWAAAAEEPERRQLLEVNAAHVHFRHELARNAIRSSIPIAARRRLHAEILDVLLATNADPSDIVHHAEAAGADEVVAGFALVAARRAASLESNREAYSHYRRAADFADLLPLAEQTALLEELAAASYVANRLEHAFSAIKRAIEIHRELEDWAGVGRCTRVTSRLYWYAGEGAAARKRAREAVAILEPLGESRELARSYSELSQLAMLEEDLEQTLVWGERALDLAIKLGDESTRAHALVNLGAARFQVGEPVGGPLVEAHEIADAAGDRHEATRALVNLSYSLMCKARPQEARQYAEQALVYAREHEVHTLAVYIGIILAWLDLREGKWGDAEPAAQGEIGRGFTVPELLAKTVLAELAVRRGDADAREVLSELTAYADRADELQRIAPVLELAAEWALTNDEPLPVEWIGQLVARIQTGGLCGDGAMRIVAWAAVAGIECEFDRPMAAPYAAMARRDWPAAADAFGEVGWDYDRALMLSLLDDEDSLFEAIEIARRLGAEPLAKSVARRLRDLGIRVPLGPRQTTRANPAGLTARQLEVLSLLLDGLTNVEIADRLVVSPRTAEHHVAAVLTKLGAPSRREAARRASELRLTA